MKKNYLTFGPGSAPASMFFRAKFDPKSEGGSGGVSEKEAINALIESKSQKAAEDFLKTKGVDFIKSDAIATEIKSIAQGIVDGLKVKHGDEDVTLETAVKSIQTHLDELSTKQKEIESKGQSVMVALKKQFDAQSTSLKSIHDSGNGVVRLDLKAATVMGLGNFGTNVVLGYREPGIDKKPLPQRFIFDLISVMNGGPGSNPLTWLEMVPKEGSPAWTAESALKQNMDWTYKENKATAEVIAVHVPITKQTLLNWPMFEQEVNVELARQLYNKLDKSIISGDGTNNTIYGMEYYAIPFSAGNLAGTVIKANVADAIRAAIGQVRKGAPVANEQIGGYAPTAVIVSEDTATSMDLEKTSEGVYVLPPFKSENGTIIKGVPVIPTNFVDDDEFIAGDLTRYLFNIVQGLVFDVGYINDQFIKNQLTIRAELYGVGRMKFNERPAIVKGKFSTAIAALTKA